MTFSLKKLSIALVAGVVTAVGFVGPAQAATLAATASSTGIIGTTGTNAYAITVSAPIITTGTANTFNIQLPTGWSLVNGTSSPAATCPSWLSVSGITLLSCSVENPSGSFYVFRAQSATAIASGATVSFTIAANSLNVAAGRSFSVWYSVGSGQFVDSGLASLSAVSTSTVTFDANGGSGSMSAQTSSSAITLTPNAFTRTNYNFAGWNTAADGSGTAYADAASYPFTSSATLYAQWTPTLANTGMSDVTWQMGEITLALMGFGILLYIRQRKRNA